MRIQRTLHVSTSLSWNLYIFLYRIWAQSSNWLAAESCHSRQVLRIVVGIFEAKRTLVKICQIWIAKASPGYCLLSCFVQRVATFDNVWILPAYCILYIYKWVASPFQRQAADETRWLPEGLQEDWAELHERYAISRGGHDGQGCYLPHLCLHICGFETSLSFLSSCTEGLVTKDLELLRTMRRRARPVIIHDIGQHRGQRTNTFNAYPGALSPQLQNHLDALASLKQTGTPHALKVFCLLLRELWDTRITDGTSKLAEQPTSVLQDLCHLIQKAMEDWEKAKCPVGNHWCTYFCLPLWKLRASKGFGQALEARCVVDYDLAFQDFEIIQAEAIKLLKSRLNPKKASAEESRAVQSECQESQVNGRTSQEDNVKTKEEMQKLNLANDSLKMQLAAIEERLKKAEEDALKSMEMKDELVQLKNDNLKMKEDIQRLNWQIQSQELRMKSDGRSVKAELENSEFDQDLRSLKKELQDLKLKNETMKHEKALLELEKKKVKETLNEMRIECQQLRLNEVASDCCSDTSWVQVLQDAETSMLHSASSCFSVDTIGQRCFMMDSLFKTPKGTFLSGTHVYLGWKDHLGPRTQHWLDYKYHVFKLVPCTSKKNTYFCWVFQGAKAPRSLQPMVPPPWRLQPLRSSTLHGPQSSCRLRRLSYKWHLITAWSWPMAILQLESCGRTASKSSNKKLINMDIN